MSKKRLFCALVIKDKLDAAANNNNIPDVKFCWAKDYDDARKVFANANWPQFYWKKGVSVCRILKLFEIFSDDFFAGETLPADILNKEVLRALPMEQIDGPVDVEERAEEEPSESSESGRSRRKRKKQSETVAGQRTARRLKKLDQTPEEEEEATPSRRRRRKSSAG